MKQQRDTLQKLFNFICKDTGSQNESSKLIVMVRVQFVIMFLLSVVYDIVASLFLQQAFLISSQIMTVVVLAMFVFSYYCKPFTSFCLYNIYILTWVIVNVILFGWDVGTPPFLIILLVFSFFCVCGYEKIKLAYSLVILVIRVALYYFCVSHDRLACPIADAATTFLIINTLAHFSAILAIVYYYSKNSQLLESKLLEYNKQLKKQAETDTLTGLSNRRSTISYLENLMKNCEDFLCICLCDIDFFKHVNDTYGHDMGDEVLKKVSSTFRSALPDKCFISRWGGEEFLIIFPHSNGDDAYGHLEILRSKMKNVVFKHQTEEFHVSLTYGLVEYDFHSDLTAFLKQADENLYYGKEHGRDRIVY